MANCDSRPPLTPFIQGTQIVLQTPVSEVLHGSSWQGEDMYHCPYATDGETEADSDTSCSKSLGRSGSSQWQ